MNYDFVTFPAIFWTVFSAVILYRRQNRLRGTGSDLDVGPGLPEKVFLICTLMMLLEEILDYIPGKLFRRRKNTEIKEMSASEKGTKSEEPRERGEQQENLVPDSPVPVRGGRIENLDAPKTIRGGAKEAKPETGKEDAPDKGKKKEGQKGGEVLLMVRWKGSVTEYSVGEIKERIKLRNPLSVLHAGPDSQHMDIEEMVTTYDKCQLQRNSVFVVDEFDNLVPLTMVVDKWNEVSKLMRHLKHDESGELKYDVISSDGLAYLYFEGVDIPPLKRSIDYVMSMVTLSKLMREGFKVIDEGGSKTMKLEEMNDLLERSEIYVSTGNCWLPLTFDRVEAFKAQYPQIFWGDQWWLATPAVLDWVVSDPTVQSQFDLKAALERVKNERGPDVGSPAKKSVPFPKASAVKKDGANDIPAPLDKKK